MPEPRRSFLSWLDPFADHVDRPKTESRERIHLAPVYALVILLIILATGASIIWRNVDLVSRFGPNMATESLGILLTVVFVRRFMEQGERSRRLRASVGALRKARRALYDLIDMWSATIKGCMTQREPGELTTLQQLCSPDHSELLLWLDATAPRATGRPERWLHWMHTRAIDARDQLDQIIGTYAGTLEPSYVEAIDALTSDPFLRGFVELTATDLEPQRWRAALNAVRGLRMAHFERLLRTLELHNRLAADVAAVRGTAAAPRSSLLGVPLTPDHDLRIDTTLDDGWWRSAPFPGSLRVRDS
jgi:hypothetical protein